ncbi:hypothetical protein [Parapedobacter sp. 2B3]|uniref:hypothetical protein n=1 Tax=Parapedobacter sp. 2B3 TaxID=3342381 RepID=UPI0035B67C8B
MKTKILTSSLIALFILLGTAALTSCSKDNSPLLEGAFDINSPEGYFLCVKASGDNGFDRRILLYEFEPGKMVKFYHAYGDDILPYTLVDDNTIVVGDNRFVFDGNLITSNREDFKEMILIEAPESNQLAGKTYAGTYHSGDGSVLHQNFFYRFASGGNTVDAGFKVGTAAVRTESYTPIGNFAALVYLDGTSDNEFMVLVNGKLEVNYKSGGPQLHYGTFAQQ